MQDEIPMNFRWNDWIEIENGIHQAHGLTVPDQGHQGRDQALQPIWESQIQVEDIMYT